MSFSQLPPELSIIIPTLNEAGCLEVCLESAPESERVQIIIADGGSCDDTLKIAARYPVTVVRCGENRGRARQMNAGARVATGRVSLFLHADSLLPADALEQISQAIDQGAQVGCFEREFLSESRLLRVTSRWAGWRARRFFIALGDQGIFVRSDVFQQMAGYDESARYEDLDFSRRAKKFGSWQVIEGPLKTSARRFGKYPLPRILKDALLIAWGQRSV